MIKPLEKYIGRKVKLKNPYVLFIGVAVITEVIGPYYYMDFDNYKHADFLPESLLLLKEK